MNSISNDDFFFVSKLFFYLNDIWSNDQFHEKCTEKKLLEKINGFAVKKGVMMKALLLMIECVLYIEKKGDETNNFFSY